jgi:NTP pyrophosphatase (non-canonical NTP hydrolase)
VGLANGAAAGEDDLMREMTDLLELMARLRDPEHGCPWDRAQTYATIVPHTIEEAYEVADAIARADWAELRDELGDLLFQVVFYAQIAREEDRFDFADVARGIVEKMTRRHPHVFGDEKYADAAEQTAAWERIKAAEKAEQPAGTLDGIPLALPGLTRAVKLQKKASKVGFDWGAVEPVLAHTDGLDAGGNGSCGNGPRAERIQVGGPHRRDASRHTTRSRPTPTTANTADRSIHSAPATPRRSAGLLLGFGQFRLDQPAAPPAPPEPTPAPVLRSVQVFQG